MWRSCPESWDGRWPCRTFIRDTGSPSAAWRLPMRRREWFPGGVGFDINCGVRLLASPLAREDVTPLLRELVNQLFRDVPSGAGSQGREQPGLSSQQRNDVNSSSVAIGTERDFGAIRRERWVVFVALVLNDAHRFPGGQCLNPDVHVSAPTPIRSISYILPVR